MRYTSSKLLVDYYYYYPSQSQTVSRDMVLTFPSADEILKFDHANEADSVDDTVCVCTFLATRELRLSANERGLWMISKKNFLQALVGRKKLHAAQMK